MLHAAFAMSEEGVGRPILIGRPDVIEARCERNAIPLMVGRDFELVNPENDPRYREYWGTYHAIMQRRGVTPDLARAIMRTNSTAIGAVMVQRGEADSLICGTFGQYLWHLNYIRQVLGGTEPPADRGAVADDPREGRDLHRRHPGAPRADAARRSPTSRSRRRGTCAASGSSPKIALCSHSQFGNLDTSSGRRMRAALEILDAQRRSTSSTTARCIRTRRSIPSSARGSSRTRASRDRRTSLIFANTDAASGVRNIIKVDRPAASRSGRS